MAFLVFYIFWISHKCQFHTGNRCHGLGCSSRRVLNWKKMLPRNSPSSHLAISFPMPLQLFLMALKLKQEIEKTVTHQNESALVWLDINICRVHINEVIRKHTAGQVTALIRADTSALFSAVFISLTGGWQGFGLTRGWNVAIQYYQVLGISGCRKISRVRFYFVYEGANMLLSPESG